MSSEKLIPKRLHPRFNVNIIGGGGESEIRSKRLMIEE